MDIHGDFAAAAFHGGDLGLEEDDTAPPKLGALKKKLHLDRSEDSGHGS